MWCFSLLSHEAQQAKKRREADVPIRAVEQSHQNISRHLHPSVLNPSLSPVSCSIHTRSFLIFCPFFLLLLCTPPCLCFCIIPSSSFVVLCHSFFSALFPRGPPPTSTTSTTTSSQPLCLSSSTQSAKTSARSWCHCCFRWHRGWWEWRSVV